MPSKIESFSAWTLLFTGMLGVAVKLYGSSPAATVLALVLGGMAEETFRQSRITSDGTWSVFDERPVSLLLCILAAAIEAPLVMARLCDVSSTPRRCRQSHIPMSRA